MSKNAFWDCESWAPGPDRERAERTSFLCSWAEAMEPDVLGDEVQTSLLGYESCLSQEKVLQ